MNRRLTLATVIICLSCSVVWSQEALDDNINKNNTSVINKYKKQINFDKTTKELVPKSNSKSSTKPKEEHKETDETEKPSVKNTGNQFISAVFYILAILGILTLVFFIFKDIKPDSSDKALPDLEEMHSNIEDITDVNFDPILYKALEEGNYRLALRIKFLRILQKLQLDGMIQWKSNKTNRRYVKEIKDIALKDDFKKIVAIFDNIWYGNMPISKSLFDKYQVIFDQFNKTTIS